MRATVDRRGFLLAGIAFVALAMLCVALASGQTVLYSQPTPDGQYRIEISDREAPGIFETYRARPWHPPGSGLRLSGTQIADWDVWSVAISADSQVITSRKGCTACYNGTSYWRYVVASIDGQFIEWALPDIFLDGFESGDAGAWA